MTKSILSSDVNVEISALKKVAIARAASICADIQLEDRSLSLLENNMPAVDFLRILINKHFYLDAIRFLARALPKREATWWAYICARSTVDDKGPQEHNLALEAAKNWVYDPIDKNRILANKAAQAATFSQPAAWVAMAAFWSSGSMAPEDAPVVSPADNLTGKAAAGAILLSAVLVNPEKADDKYRFFLQQGIDIANGGNGNV